MHNFNVINKGEYNSKQTSSVLHVERFLMLRGKHCRYLLLDLENKNENVLTGFGLQIDQYDARGNSLGVVDVSFKDLNENFGRFILKDKIQLHHACSEFFIKVVFVEYGEYKFLLGKSGEYSVFNKKKEKAVITQKAVAKEVGKTGVKWTHRVFSKPVFICVLSVIMMLALVGITYFQLKNFKETSNTFVLSNVEYQFVTDTEGNKEVEVIGYVGKGGGNLVIPQVIENYPVVRIDSNAFTNNKIIKSLTIEGEVIIDSGAFYGCENLKEANLVNVSLLGLSAFENCSSLQSVVIGATKNIGSRSFKDCVNLQSITLPATIESVGDMAFENCEKLTSLSISGDVKYIGASVLRGCRSIKSIEVPFFGSTEGENLMVGYLFGLTNYLYQNNDNYVPHSIEEITLSKQTELNQGAFYGLPNLKKVGLAEITKIEKDAFVDCYRLLSLEIPSTVAYISEEAFEHNFKLFEVINNSENVSITKGEGAGEYAIKVYSLGENLLEREVVDGCTFLEDDMGIWHLIDVPEGGTVNIPNGVKGVSYSIPDYFFFFFNADDVVLNGDTVKIGNFAFNNTKIKNITFKTGAHTLGKEVFANNGDLVSVNLYESYILEIPQNTFSNNGSLEKVVISSATEELLPEVFTGCTNLKYVGLSPVLKELKEGYFSNFSLLEEVGFNGNNVIKSIENKTFEFCRNLKEIKIPSSVTRIGEGAFHYCSTLSKVELPSNLEVIDDSAFNSCRALDTIILPPLLKSVGNSAFNDCSNLSTLLFSQSLERIGQSAFSNCASLASIELPNGLLEIGDNAFNNCYLLSSIKFPNELLKIGNFAFSNCNKLTTLELANKIETIGEYAFSSCVELKTVTLPSSLKDLGRNAFDWCNSLESVRFSADSNLNSINESVFMNCKSLKSIEIPSSVEIIKTDAFNGCSSLQKVHLAMVREIGGWAFSGCTSLKEVDFPRTLKTIGRYSFANSNLEVVYLRSVLSIDDYAFSECKFLHEVYDISGENNLSLGTRDNGCIGLYALVVRQSETTPRLKVHETVDKVFKYDDDFCALISYRGEVSNVVLDKVVIGGVERSYAIASYAFNDHSIESLTIKGSVTDIRPYAVSSSLNVVKFEGASIDLSGVEYAFNFANYVIFDKELKGLAYNTFAFVSNLLYSGNESEWNNSEYKNNFNIVPQRFYSKCFHSVSNNNWNYNENSEINFSYQSYKEKDLVLPTCTNDGSYVLYCEDCGHLETITLTKYGHDYSYKYMYKCNTCNEINPFTLSANTKDFCSGVISIANDLENPFKIFEGEKTSEIFTNGVPKLKNSSVKFNAKCTLTIELELSLFISVENSAKVIVDINGENKVTLDKTTDEKLVFKLNEGDVLTLNFQREDVDDETCFTSVKNIKISN